MIDWIKVEREVIKSLRAPRSQQDFSKELGFSYDRIQKIESGRRRLLWSEFVHIAQRCDRDLEFAVNQFLFFSGPVERYDLILRGIVGPLTHADVQDRTSVSRFKLRRWLSREVSPSFSEMMLVADTMTPRAVEFVGAIVDPESIPSLCEHAIAHQVERKACGEYPLAQALLRGLELDEYKSKREHSSSYLAKKIGCSESEVEHGLNLLEAAGCIWRDGASKWNCRHENIWLNVDRNSFNNMRAYWHKRVRYGIKSREIRTSSRKYLGNMLGFSLFSVSESAFVDLKNHYLEFQDKVRATVEMDMEESKIVVLTQTNLVDLETLP